MAGVPQAGAHLWTQHDSLYTLFSPPCLPPLPCFPTGWVLQVHNLIRGFTFVIYLLICFVIWCQSVAILLFPRCLSALLVVLIWWFASKSSLNKDHRSGGWCQAFRCLFRCFLGHAMTCSMVWSGAGYSCSVYDKIYIYTPIYTYIQSVRPWDGLSRR